MTTRPTPKILCVDDEPAVLDALARLLRADFEVLKASNAEQGFEILHHHPDLAVVLSDYRMPGMTGIEFLRRVKASHPTATRAILSGQIDAQQLAEAINTAEIHRFILKPWDNTVLRLQMLESLQSHAVLAERHELHHMAITDPVTQLTNHRYFQQRLKDELQAAAVSQLPLSLIMIDVDHFKNFNDHYGHPEGDRLLAEIAMRISHIFPEKGTASRYGGEEFVILLPNTDIESACQRAELLREQMESQPFTGPNGRSAYVTLSLGVSNSSLHGLIAAELVSAADRALYQAKRQGRNQTMAASS